MKKSLLILAAFLGSVCAMAQTDGQTYSAVNGVTCESKWCWSRNANSDKFLDTRLCNTDARTVAIHPDNSKIYITVGNDNQGNYLNSLLTYDLETGEYEGEIALTVIKTDENGDPVVGDDGTPEREQLEAQLGANNIIVDDFGNVIAVGYVNPTSSKPIVVYTVDVATGEMTEVASLELPADEMDAAGRMDYCYIIGDVTGVQAPALFMCAINGDNLAVYRWRLEQGASEWVGDFDGYVSFYDFDGTYPADQVIWNTAPWVTIVNDNDEFSGDYFYVDGNNECPTLYNTAGSMIESFASVPDLAPSTGTNGVAEFSLGDKNFVVYSEAQYDVTPGCRVNICELGPGMSFDGMELYWQLPANGLGEVSDGGTRVHGLCTKNVTDANGKEAVLFVSFKCYNGIALYQIAEEGYDDGSSKVESIDADIAAAATISVVGKVITVSAEASDIAVYNLAGQKIAEVKNATQIAAPASGAYIVKAIVDGAAVVEKVIL